MQTTFSATDGFALRGEFYGDAALAKGGVLIAPAMGVHQRYYADFSCWLADRGYLVLSFDLMRLRHWNTCIATWPLRADRSDRSIG
jgi:predicted alpha/beta hydrolase